MEFFGLILAIPVALVASVIYCAIATLLLKKVRALRKAVLVASLLVLACVALEIGLIGTLGVNAAYQRLQNWFGYLHAVCFLLGPPSLANLVLFLLCAMRETWTAWRIALSGLICWVACIVAVFGNLFAVDAIAGPDSSFSWIK
jgi:hypothetical protein